MRWQGRTGSSNIEDRRGMRMGLPIGGGIGGLVLLLLFSALTGQNPADLISSAPPQESVGTTGTPADEQGQFVAAVLGDTEQVWGEIFAERGSTYRPPTLVLFTDATQTACGVGQAAMGPFYCPPDRKLYIDLSFFQELDRRFGAPGDFAQAYVIAHEVGHHIQTLTGRAQPGVALELQADCYAGVWGNHARDWLDPGDVEEGLAAAAAIGDDRLQRQTQGRVVPESFTHGSSAQRVKWLRQGLESGRPEACDTSAG
jgi:uncharacterized protein